MGIFRHRGGFDGVNQPREDQNLTKYDQKYTLPTDLSNGGYNSVPTPEPMFSGSNQQAPAPDPSEQSFVFGGGAQSPDGRQSVFGGSQQSDGRSNVFGGAPAMQQQSFLGGNVQPAVQQPAPMQQQQQSAFSGLNAGFNVAPMNGGYSAPSMVQDECPMVFALRANPEMFVYEYSNRLEFFRRTEIGMVHCYTENKAKKY